jgi:hypothetical protein
MGIRHAVHVALSNPQKLVLTSLTSGDRSVGIIRSRTKATVFPVIRETGKVGNCWVPLTFVSRVMRLLVA